MVNPGTLPVEGATEAAAAANMSALIEGVAERGDWLTGEVVRDEQADRDGRFGYLLPSVAGTTVRVLMPGIDLSRLTGAQRLSATAPCLYINDTPWWWKTDAVDQAAHAAEAAALAATETSPLLGSLTPPAAA